MTRKNPGMLPANGYILLFVNDCGFVFQHAIFCVYVVFIFRIVFIHCLNIPLEGED